MKHGSATSKIGTDRLPNPPRARLRPPVGLVACEATTGVS